jgi:hypothetical protein
MAPLSFGIDDLPLWKDYSYLHSIQCAKKYIDVQQSAESGSAMRVNPLNGLGTASAPTLIKSHGTFEYSDIVLSADIITS